MLFADDSGLVTWPMVLMAAVTAVPTALASAGGAIAVYHQWAEKRRKDALETAKQQRTDALAEWQDIAARVKAEAAEQDARQEKRIGLLELAVKDGQQAIAKVQGSHSRCVERANRQRINLEILYAHAEGQNEALQKLGGQVRPIPKLLADVADETEEVDFQVRQSQHTAAMSQALEKKIAGQSGGKP